MTRNYAATQSTTAPRLAPRTGEVIDRSRTYKFTFDGREYLAHPGDTIASALAAAGVKVLARSFKYHRPRGLLCCAGACPNCLVQVGNEPNVPACQRAVEPGMKVKHQNAWPSLEHDVMSLTRFGERLLPVGFYYKTFIRPRQLWPLYERTLRHTAGLGTVSREVTPHEYDKQYLYAQVVVVGGGPAGMSAAQTAAEQGASVLLVDENSSLGGHLRFSHEPADSILPPWSANIKQTPNLTLLNDTTVVGIYLDRWLSAVSRTRLFKIRAGAVIFATGAYERPLLFDDNDLPGVMLGGAVQRLINLYRVVPGRRAVIVTANDNGWQVAADLRGAGIEIAAIVDERDRNACASPHLNNLSDAPILWEHTIHAARGAGAVSGAIVAPVDENAGERKTLDCDLIAVSVGWTPATELAHMAGAKSVYDHARAELLPAHLPAGFFVAGRAVGTHNVETQIAEGKLAGLSAAAFVGKGAPPVAERAESLAQMKMNEPRRSSARVLVPGYKKQFLCFCEDVSKHDLDIAIQEGFDRLELLKRYSTISMGPCQGKMCAMNAIELVARANGSSVQETGTTTARPPLAPVALGNLAGQHMEPVQLTCIHEWHQARGAVTINAGTWVRPLHYGDPTAEVKAVRERVGMIDVSTLGKIRLTGPGVPQFLERIYTNQWRTLGIGNVRYGVMCNDEGVILDDGVCAHLAEDEWYLTTTSSGAGAIYEWIQWWLQSGWGEGVHATDLTEAFAAFNLAGPKSRAVLQKITNLDVSNQAFPYLRIRSAHIAGVPCRVWRIGFTGELSYEIHCPTGYGLHLWQGLMDAGKEFGIAPFGMEAQRVLRLEKGHIIVSQDTDALSDPISANMSWVVKMDKPDFLGKRALMRILEMGPTQRLVGFTMGDSSIIPEEGTQVVVSKPEGRFEIIGRVTSSRYSYTLNKSIGLCWLPADLASRNGAAFTICLDASLTSAQSKLAQAQVYHGAFYDPQGERLRA